MLCPKCQNADTKVVDSRTANDLRAVRRRRECEKCAHRFTTFERVEVPLISVEKNDGNFENFDREKLKKSISLACGKRPISPEKIEKIVAEIEEKCATNKKNSTHEIGEAVMQKLKNLDSVAFIRFASVYRSFRDIDEFKSEIAQLFRAQKKRKI